MRFFLTDHAVMAPLELFASVALYLALPIGLPLVLWLRQSPRRPRDVLGTEAVAPSALLRKIADSMGGLGVLALVVPQVAVTGLILHGALTDNCFEAIVIGPDLFWPAGVVFLTSVGLLPWLRRPIGPSSPGDVLRVQTGH